MEKRGSKPTFEPVRILDTINWMSGTGKMPSQIQWKYPDTGTEVVIKFDFPNNSLPVGGNTGSSS